MDICFHAGRKGEELTMEDKSTRAERGLGKYDAPLKVQFERGYLDFKRGRVNNPFHSDTMQYREWERGFNAAYFENLKRVKENEKSRTGSTRVLAGEV
jgi:hypothetical protein